MQGSFVTLVRATTMVSAFVMAAAPALAQAVQSDLVVAARALGFLENPPTGDVTVGIVYAPVAASRQDADALRVLLGAGLRVGNITLKPVLVGAGELGTADIDLLFLVSGLDEQTGIAAANLSATKKIPCITITTAYLEQGRCVMAVRSRPKVEILVNQAAAARSNTKFAAVFRMMIKEF
jgi:hypothetical protein